MSKHFKLFLCFLFLFLAALAILYIPPGGRKGQEIKPNQVSVARDACKTFLSNLKAGNFKQAHSLLSTERQTTVSENQLKRLWLSREKRSGKVDRWQHPSPSVPLYSWDGRTGEITSKFRLSGAGQADEFSPSTVAEFICVEENGNWKIRLFRFI